MMLKTLLISTLATASLAEILDWETWKSTYNMKFSPQQDLERHQVFQQNVQKIKVHNAKYESGESTYYLGTTKFAHLTDQEFRAGPGQPGLGEEQVVEFECPVQYQASGSDLPASVDWRDPTQNPRNVNAVTAIKNQENCGSCWSFGATGTMEGQLCLAGQYDCDTWTGLSEQEIIDCTAYNYTYLGEYDTAGCGGGFSSNALRWVSMVGGVTDETTEPYESGNGYIFQCDQPPAAGIESSQICGSTSYEGPNADLLQDAIANVGPVQVSINASLESFHMYMGGVYAPMNCNPNTLDHAVLNVGYGTYVESDGSEGAPYWIIKNSWGTGWGIDGYIMMYRGVDMCGCESNTVFSIVE